MKKETIRKSYTSMLYNVSKRNIDKFELVKYHRHLRESQIGALHSVLLKGNHFESQIVVNERDSKLRIIDGGHRVMAMRKFLKSKPDMKVEVNMALYKDLDDDEEKKVFATWNKGIKQSPDDYIHLRKGDLKMLRMIELDFPCKVSIYNQKGNALKFSNLIKCYLGVKTYEVIGTFQSGGEKLVEEIMKLKQTDYDFLYDFMKGFVKVFGHPNKNNMFSNTNPLCALMRVYYDNYYEKSQKEFWDRVSKYIYPSSIIRQYGIMRGREFIKNCHTEMLNLINRGLSVNKYVLREKVE